MSSQRAMSAGNQKSNSSANDAEDDLMCPLCMEVLDETDRNFYPCTCDYQVCLWCLHYIRTTMGNKCPACRRDYDESNMKYKSNPRAPAPQRAAVTKKKRELGDKEATTREERPSSPRTNTGSINLKDVRVIQRNLVYVVGIPTRVAKKEVLKQNEYFGQYGKIQHLVLNKSQNYNSHIGGPSYTAYVTYSKKSEAAAAIQGIDGSHVDGKMLRASYGTTKYCTFFFKGLKCTNPDCFYLHHFGDERERIVKEDISSYMQKAPNPPFGVVDPWNDQGPSPKYKEDPSARKRPEQATQTKMAPAPSDKPKEAEDREKTGVKRTGMGDHETGTSWAHIAAGAREVNAKSTNVTYYTYPNAEEPQPQYAVLGDTYGEGYSNSLDAYRQQRKEADATSGDRFMNHYNYPVEMESSVNGGPNDIYDIIRRLFNTPLLIDLQRYNRFNHIFYAVEGQLRPNGPSGKQEVQGDDDGKRWGSCIRWIIADDVKNLGAFHLSNRRMQIDYYRETNHLIPYNEAESVIAGSMAIIAPRELFADRDRVLNIQNKMRRHSIMVENLAKLYSDNDHNRRSQPRGYQASSSEFSKSIMSTSGNISEESVADYTQRSFSGDVNSHNRQQISSILYTSSLQESQLEAELKVHEEMVEQLQQLVELQLERDKRVASHLQLLNDL
ncbi:ccr4-not transcription complex subunit 4 [Babesia gibsoni]|uniref:Ccr4-not transcription complex subunit 4 n=1 Tax=Babesia gibsoni TaxID=33632 RepID=A0AAD8LIR1_BABGI|nr:ccr4-not transcription complex subunit 4 [Babesia gibsoni]